MTTTVSERDTGDFTASLGCLLAPSLAELTAQLGAVAGLGATERDAIHAGAVTVLTESVHRKVSRVLLLELNAARVTGRLTATTARERWAEFIARSSTMAYWESLGEHYPTLLPRLRTVVDNRCAAALQLARRFAADRAALGDTDPGELIEVSFGAGDSHRGGQTVALLRGDAATVVYKPRSVAVDAVLATLIDRLLPDEPAATRIRVPSVLVRDGYGWAEHITHRYCADESELRAFYRGFGQWLAVMRLLGGTDLHAENVLAAGPVPVVVDCEALFTPQIAGPPSGLGLAVDRAGALVENTVLRIGMLPGRGVELGWRGIDMSAVGALPGQQPRGQQPVIVDGGTDVARLGTDTYELQPAANHPSPQPALSRHWGDVLAGFDQLTERLTGLDRPVVWPRCWPGSPTARSGSCRAAPRSTSS